MAYQTGDVISVEQTYDALITFMTANGWTVYDNIPITGSRDKVLFSAGSGGKLNMYYRISSNQIGNPIKAAYNDNVKFPYVQVRGYHSWNQSTHSGSGEYGVWGPLVWGGEQTSSTGNNYVYPFERSNGSLATPGSPTGYRYNLYTNASNASYVHDGRRRVWGMFDTGAGFADIVSPENVFFSAGTAAARNNGMALVKDTTLNKEFVFIMDGSTSNFLRLDVDAGSYQTMALPPWGAGSAGGGVMMWDGGDFIYHARGQATTTFARYSISANTWTSLAVLPVALPAHAPASSQCSVRLVYVPNSVTGIGEDVIYALIADAVTVIYRYDVTSNAWRSTGGTGALTSPTSITASTILLWDGQRYMYYWQPASIIMYRSDLTTAPGTFSQILNTDSAVRTFVGGLFLNNVVSKLRCNNTIPGKYFFHGDSDGMRLVYRVGTSVGNGKYYWAYLGKYDTNYRPQIMGVTAAVSAGVRTVVSVDSTTGFNNGQTILMANWSGSHFEATTIYQVSGSNAFLCNLTSSFPSGSRAGIDPGQNVLTGEGGIAITPIDASGNRTDLEPAWYVIQPDFSVTDMARYSPSTRDAYMPVKMLIYNGMKTTNEKYESLGYLKNVFSLLKTTFPGPQSEDILAFGSDNYVYFNVEEMQKNVTDTRGIVIGPI